MPNTDWEVVGSIIGVVDNFFCQGKAIQYVHWGTANSWNRVHFSSGKRKKGKEAGPDGSVIEIE